MKVGGTQVVIGKRVTVGALIKSLGATFAVIYPDYAAAILASTIAVTFTVQVAIAHWSSITTKEI